MERCLTPHTMETMDWNRVFNDDEEWTFMLSRMDYWTTLAKAALISQDTRYLDQAKTYMLDWIASIRKLNTAGQPARWTRASASSTCWNARCFWRASEKLDEEELTWILGKR